MFLKAKPIWPKGYTCEMNIHTVFYNNLCDGAQKIRIAGTAFYRLYVDGVFVASGPARTAHGCVRVDEIMLPSHASEILIEAVGYYCKTIATCHQPSFLMAEMIDENGQVVAYTGKDFDCYMPNIKIQKSERYSVQRHFTEVWDYRKFTTFNDEKYQVPYEIVDEQPIILERKAPYPIYENVNLKQAKICGELSWNADKSYKEQRYSWAEVPKFWGIFEKEEIMTSPHTWIQRHEQVIEKRNVALPLELNEGQYAIFDFGQIEAGFLQFDVECFSQTDLIFAFTEYYEGDTFTYQNMNVHNAIEYFLDEKSYQLQSFEPYTYRYAIVAVKNGRIKLNHFGVKTYMLDTKNAVKIDSDDDVLNRVYRAALRNYAHNEVDLYMDCPSRERAGWIGDAYFTAKGEFAITGKTCTEDAFLENYLRFKNLGDIPQGMIPECYPSDIPPKGDYIPQFSMFYILEVEEYITQRGHENFKELFKKQIYDLLTFYKQYENEDGLIERLPSWNFVEWGTANDWIQDVSYPTNFLYSKVLEKVGMLYDDNNCLARSKQVRETAHRQSFNGTYFLDHSVRNVDGKLELQGHVSEVGQYYAVLFGNVNLNDDTYKELRNLILHIFSPERKPGAEEVLEFNMIMGAYMRMEVLLKHQEYKLLTNDIKLMFGHMEEKTGTLWEYRIHKGSYDHGICAYVAHAIQKSLDGLRKGN